MNASVYAINKGVNRPLEFKGFKAQYIWYLGAGLLCLLILFAVLYICGVSPFICLLLVGVLGAGLFLLMYRLSRRYGPYGLMKKVARKRVPRLLKNDSRKLFTTLWKKG